jgi:hypothetical protein
MTTIKIGSEGQDVITLQKILEIAVDGFFGANTRDAVIAFQKQYNLIADGIVGPITWAALIGTGDSSVNKEHEFVEYMLTKGKQEKDKWIPNYYPGPFNKRWLVFHHTAGWDNPKATVDFWSNDSNSVATEFVVGGVHISGRDNGHDGVTVQCMPKGAYAWHLTIGNTPLHRESIGVEICSMGGLTKGGYYKIINGKNAWVAGQANSYYTAYGNVVSESQVYDLGWTYRFHRYFHKYSDKQIEQCQIIAEHCRDEYGMNVKAGLAEHIRKYGVEKAFGYILDYANRVPGIYTHGNVFQGKNDIYPDPRMIDMILSL